jgi:HD-GYP domain-containing protein (c-di-GMP phosphodiesterase class II)
MKKSDQSISDQLFMLLNLGREISTTTNLDMILKILGDTARDILKADRCSIFIYDEEHNELWTRMAHGVDEIRVSADVGVVGKAALSKEVQIVIDAYKDFRFHQAVDLQTGYVTKNILAVPLLNYENKTIGVFQALNKKEGTFDNIDAELLILIGNYASVSLENALLYERLQRSQIKLINKLSEAAEFKDSETSAHTKRVGLYTQLIAKELGKDAYYCNLIKLTSPMHDIGKIGISDEILLKPGKLSEEEFNVMKNHSEIGYKILYEKDDEILRMAAQIALEHHEKYDGSGYPKGLSKEEISLAGRITAVADVFDALTSQRPYKKAWSFEEAISFIKQSAGSHFDPAVVDAFLKNIEEFLQIKQKYQD